MHLNIFQLFLFHFIHLGTSHLLSGCKGEGGGQGCRNVVRLDFFLFLRSTGGLEGRK